MYVFIIVVLTFSDTVLHDENTVENDDIRHSETK